jgi:cobalt-zinc-cadmium efflux system protein
MLGDAVSAFGVVLAGVIVTAFHVHMADPIASLLIAALILYSSFGVFRESVTVLLEGTPAGIDMPSVITALRGVPGVIDIHDLHVWVIGPGVLACSCHIVVAEQSVSDGQRILRAVSHELHECFHINHTTIQVEAEHCASTDMHCTPLSAAGVHHH